jgi:hypothetical protein
MSDPVVENLVLDLLEWRSNRTERTYEEVMDAHLPALRRAFGQQSARVDARG